MKRSTVEIWVPVVGYEGYYEVSSWGRVRSLDRVFIKSNGRKHTVRERIRAPHTDDWGRVSVGLTRSGESKTCRVHRLVLEAFVGPCPPGMVACHANDDASDNRLENLRWDTPRENNLDKVRNGNDHNVRKTRCPQGHSYSGNNLRTYQGRRYCRKCTNDRNREYKKRKREKRQ